MINIYSYFQYDISENTIRNVVLKSIAENEKRNVRQIASTTIAIIVDDVNDNLPLFRKHVYKTTVRENSDRGTVISRIFADDLDRNRSITYR